MKINFRQGIIKTQTNLSFLRLNDNGNVDFNATYAPTYLSFSDGSSEYLYVESDNITDAWVLTNIPCWLYWELSKEDASRSFSTTPYNPFLYNNIPTEPNIGQLYFDKNIFKWKQWDGQYWQEKIIVIAGYVNNSKIINQSALGSQINYLQSYQTDYIIYDDTASPIKNYIGDSYEFLTKYTIINFKNNKIVNYSYDRIIDANGIADQPLTKHYCVSWKNYNTLQLSSNDLTVPSFAIVERTVNTGEIVSVSFSGYVTNRTDWNWSLPPHTLLYVGNDGEITPTFDSTKSVQIIGYVVNQNTIYLTFGEQFKRISPTPSISLSSSIALTPTPSISPTSSLALTPVVSATNTPVPSQTAQPSSFGTFSPTPTPTITNTPITPTPTPSVGTLSIYDQTVLTKNPLAYWSLNNDLTDTISSNNNLSYRITNNYGVYLTPDSYGHYIFFDSPSNGLTFNVIELQSSYTLEAWISVANLTPTETSLSDNYYTIFGTNVYGLQIDATNPNAAKLGLFSGTDTVYAQNLTISANTVYHIVMVCDADNVISFYVNGTYYAGDALSSDTYSYSYIGADATVKNIGDSSSVEYFYGIIGNPAIYGYTLSPQQIYENYTVGTTQYRYQTNIPQVSHNLSSTPTPTPTGTQTLTPTVTPTISLTATNTPTNTTTPTQTLTPSPTITITPSSSSILLQTTFSSSNLATDIILSNGNTIATSNLSTESGGMVLSNSSKTSGKYYVEVQQHKLGSFDASNFGLHIGTSNLNAQVGDDANGFGTLIYGSGGGTRGTYNNGTITNIASLTWNDYMIARMAVDIDAGYVWLSYFGTSAWVGGGDPASGTNPTFTFTPGSTCYIAACPRSNSQEIILTNNGSWTYAAPTGFGVWYG